MMVSRPKGRDKMSLWHNPLRAPKIQRIKYCTLTSMAWVKMVNLTSHSTTSLRKRRKSVAISPALSKSVEGNISSRPPFPSLLRWLRGCKPDNDALRCTLRSLLRQGSLTANGPQPGGTPASVRRDHIIMQILPLYQKGQPSLERASSD